MSNALFTIVEFASLHTYCMRSFALPIAFIYFGFNGFYEEWRDRWYGARAIFKEDISGQLINGFWHIILPNRM